MHLRAYICKIALYALLPSTIRSRVDLGGYTQNRQHAWRALHDVVTLWRGAASVGMPTTDICESLWTPLTWIMQCIAVECTTDDVLTLIEYCKQDDFNVDLLMIPMLRALPSALIADECVSVAQLILRKNTPASIARGALVYSMQKHFLNLCRYCASTTISAYTEVRLASSTFVTFKSFHTAYNSTPCMDVGNATWRRLIYRGVY